MSRHKIQVFNARDPAWLSGVLASMRKRVQTLIALTILCVMMLGTNVGKFGR